MLAPAGRDHLSFRERKDSMRYLGHIDFRRETAIERQEQKEETEIERADR